MHCSILELIPEVPGHPGCGMRRAALLVALCALLLTPNAPARNADGTLNVIQTPNNGVPALLEKAGNFEALLTRRGALHLERDGQSIPLECAWNEQADGQFRAQCTVPASAAPGAYALRWTGDSGEDRNLRAVHVWDKFPEYYTIAHVTDTHLGKRPDSEDANLRVFQAVNESEAVLTMVTGDLSEGGEMEQFQAVLRVLDSCRMPTFVCPGNHDRKDNNYALFFGSLCYAFRFSRDGYIAFDTKDYVTGSELGPQDGLLHHHRRAIKDARWAIGLTHRYESSQGMRSQLTLFVDDPLDYLLWGHRHRENAGDEKTVPWGTTPIRITPAAISGRWRLVDITEQGPRPRPFTEVALPNAGTQAPK